MNKIAFIFIFFIVIIGYIFSKDKILSNNFTLINNLKHIYVEYLFEIEDFFDKYFLQTKTIEKLAKENEDLVKFQSLYISKKLENEAILEANNLAPNLVENIELAKVLSYVNLNDFTSVWLDGTKEDDTIQGLIDGEFSAGIVINKSGYAKALLNGNEKANYAVYVGENKAPGIIHPNQDSRYLTVRYIPIWIEINVDDEVVTSSMDNIFFEGLKVGKVISIKKMADLQEAVIKPYSEVFKKKYFYIYTKKENILVEPEKTPLVESIQENVKG